MFTGALPHLFNSINWLWSMVSFHSLIIVPVYPLCFGSFPVKISNYVKSDSQQNPVTYYLYFIDNAKVLNTYISILIGIEMWGESSVFR